MNDEQDVSHLVDDSQIIEVLNQQSNTTVGTSNNACGLDEQVITSTGDAIFNII